MKKRKFLVIIFWMSMALSVQTGKGGNFGDEITGSIVRSSLSEINLERERFSRLPDVEQAERGWDISGYIPDEIIVKYKEGVAERVAQDLKQGRGVRDLRRMSRSRSRVKRIEPLFKDFKAQREKVKAIEGKDWSSLERKERQLRRRLERASRTVKTAALDRVYKLEVELGTGERLEEVVAALNEDPEVEYAQLNFKFNLSARPNDNLYALQWALENIGQAYPPVFDRGEVDRDIEAEAAWDISTGSEEVVIAVIDTGVDYRHRDLNDNMWINDDEFAGDFNNDGYPGIGEQDDDGDGLVDEDSQGHSRFLEDGRTPNPEWINDLAEDDDENGFADDFYGYDFCRYDDGQWDADPLDDHGHGTHCAGIIAAEGNNGVDIAGVNWSARIMAVKFLSYNGSGSTIDAIKAIEYAVNNGAQVLSNSWGRRGGVQGANPAMQEVIDYAASMGVVVVAAAGNDDDDNSVTAHYPANYNHVISVAATDSADAKASFSNFGEAVDIAAPGVDILSLRATGLSLGTVYDETTTVASGTSMAGPQVAGAVGLLLAYDDTLSAEQIEIILRETGDPIAEGICQSDARLNLHQALRAAQGQGMIQLDRDFYSGQDELFITLIDMNHKGQGQQAVVLEGGGDRETILLAEDVTIRGSYHGGIFTTEQTGGIQDGALQVTDGDIVTVSYQDADNGAGAVVWASDYAVIDGAAPVIRHVRMEATITIPVITFETDEPARGRIIGGITSVSQTIELQETNLSTQHQFKLRDLQPGTRYFFKLAACDQVGNMSEDDNYGSWYTFITPNVLINGYVPSQFGTIQAAIDHAWDGDTIWIADGVYQGEGNFNLNFDGRAITLRSENGPEQCIIDCAMQGRGFIFDNGEGADSILDGLTIKQGFATSKVSFWHEDGYGGGIFCRQSRPTIRNCILRENEALTLGGGLYAFTDMEIVIENCRFIENRALYGGGIHSEGGIWLRSCALHQNKSKGAGGGLHLYGEVVLDDVDITHNTAGQKYNDFYAWGGGIFGGWGQFTIRNTRISENQAYLMIGGIGLGNCDLSMSNSIIGDNTAPVRGGGNFFHGDFNFTHCVIANNEALQAKETRGLVIHPYSRVSVENSILWHDSTEEGYEIYMVDLDGEDAAVDAETVITVGISTCDVKGGESGVYVGEHNILNWGTGNIESEPDFAFARDYHLMGSSLVIDAGTNHPVDGSPVRDADGNPRILDGDGSGGAQADMGIFEYNRQAPTIALSKEWLQFQHQVNQITPESDILYLRNAGGGVLNWQIQTESWWLEVDQSSGQSKGEIDELTLTINSAGLPVGRHEGELLIRDAASINQPRIVRIILEVRRGYLFVPDEFRTIQLAINAAVEGDVVLVADGVYRGNGNRDLFIDKAITLRSENGSDQCIIDCEGSEDDPHRGIFLLLDDKEETQTVIEGFTIINGFVNEDLFAPVLGFVGGGILCHTDRSLVMIRDCVVAHCEAAWHGGGIHVEGTWGMVKSYITSCRVSDNQAERGGGISVISGLTDIRNVILSGNSGKLDGGGLYYMSEGFGGRSEIINCTVIDNHSRASGGGIHFEVSKNSDEIWLRNSILRGNQIGIIPNSGPGSQAVVVYAGHDINDISELKVSYCDIEDITGGIFAGTGTAIVWQEGNIDVDAGFDDEFRLSASSLCIDAGNPSEELREPAENRLTAYLKLDEHSGVLAGDNSDSGHDGTVYGDEHWRPGEGRSGGALYFDGSGDYITVDGVVDDIADKHVTVMGWFQSDTTARDQALFSFNAGTGEAQLIVGHPDGSRNLHAWYRSQWRDTGVEVFDGEWHFVACVLYNKLFRYRMILYVDGERISVFENTLVSPSAGDRFSLGQSYNDAYYPSRFFTGLIDEVRVYRTPLNYFAVRYLYTEGGVLAANPEDVDLQPRMAGGRVDIGAHEYQFQTYHLDALVEGEGIVLPPAGVYGAGKVVSLTAIPRAGFRINRWYGADDDTSSASVNTVTMNSDKTVTVEFEELVRYTLSTRVTGAGSITPRSGPYWNDTVVQLEATPAPGWRIKSWTGTNDDLSKEPINTVTMNADRQVIVEFEEIPRYTLRVQVAGAGVVGPMEGLFEEGSVVQLEATPAPGWRIKSWSGTDDDLSTATNNTAIMNADRQITVTFEIITYQLITRVRTGQGQITPSGGIYEYGTVVALNAEPNDCYRLKRWQGTDDDLTDAATNSVTMNADKTVSVDFELIYYELTIEVVNGHGNVRTIPNGPVYICNTEVVLQAEPEADYEVKSWHGAKDDTTRASLNSVVMDADKTVRVEFGLQEFVLSTGVIDGQGTITPDEGVYTIGSKVDLEAVPATFYRLARWEGTEDDASQAMQNQVVLDSDKTVMVEFAPAAIIRLERINITADQRIEGVAILEDSIELRGTFNLSEALIGDAKEINIKLLNAAEIVLTETFPWRPDEISQSGRYSYTDKLGGIKTIKFDLTRQNFSLLFKKVDLTGLASPLVLQMQIGDYYGVGLATDDYEQYLAMGGADDFRDVINGRRRIPISLMQGYADVLRVEKAKVKHRKRKNVDSLVLQGHIATASPMQWDALINEGLQITWGQDDYTDSAPPGKFMRLGQKYLYKKRKNDSGTIESAVFDRVKGTFKIVINNAVITTQTGEVDVGIIFGGFHQVYPYNLNP